MARSQSESSNDATEPFSQLRLHFTDDAQTRYEIARPLLIGNATSAVERAQETQTHPQTVRGYVRRFERIERARPAFASIAASSPTWINDLYRAI